MSYVNAAPEYVAAAATDLANIGSTISSANTAAMGPTSGVLAAGADEVSATVAALFDAHAQVYQALSAQAAYFHEQFVQLLNVGASHYALAEAANASPLQTIEQGVLSVADAPSGQTLTAAQSVIGSAASAGSVASSLPAMAAGAAGAAATPVPAAAAGYVTLAGSPAPVALATLSTPAAAAPAAVSTPAAALHAVAPNYATAASAAPAAVSAPAAAMDAAATPDYAPATTSPASAVPPVGPMPAAAGEGRHAARPGTPAYSPEASGQQGYDEESVGRHQAY
jgi:PE family